MDPFFGFGIQITCKKAACAASQNTGGYTFGLHLVLAVLFGRSMSCFIVEFTTRLQFMIQMSLGVASVSMLYFTYSVPSQSITNLTLSLLSLGISIGTVTPVAERMAVVFSYPISHGRVMATQQALGNTLSALVIPVAAFMTASGLRGEHLVFAVLGSATVLFCCCSFFLSTLSTPVPASSSAPSTPVSSERGHGFPSFGSMGKTRSLGHDDSNFGLPEYSL